MADNNEDPVPPPTDKSNGKSSPSDENTSGTLNPQVELQPPTPSPSHGVTAPVPQIILHRRCFYVRRTEAEQCIDSISDLQISMGQLDKTLTDVKQRLASEGGAQMSPQNREDMKKSMLQFAADMEAKMREMDQKKLPAKEASKQSQKPAAGAASTASISSSQSSAPKTSPKPPQKAGSSKAVTASIASSQSPASQTAPKPPQKAESSKAVTASTSGSQSSTAMTASGLKVVNIDVVRTCKSGGDRAGLSLSDVWAGGSFKSEFQECVRRMLDTVERTQNPLLTSCLCTKTATDSPMIEEESWALQLKGLKPHPEGALVGQDALSTGSSTKTIACSINLYPDEVQPDVANVKEEEEKMDVEEKVDVKQKDDVKKEDDSEGGSHKPKRKREA